MKRLFLSILLLTSYFLLPCSAAVRLPHIFSQGMVLQQQTSARLWGDAAPRATVSLRASWGATATATADKAGHWTATIATPPATATPHTLTITDGTQPLTIRDVLIGEVWFASGQSNMEMSVNGFWNCPVEGAADVIAAADEYPLIRFATAPLHGATTPQTDIDIRWERASTATVPRMSATAYFFAQQLTRTLHVPVGIVAAPWGGSKVEGWLPEEIVSKYKDIDIERERCYQADGKSWNWLAPTIMYNGLLCPLAGYTVRGFLWYQGESNVGTHTTYAERLCTMVHLWRTMWQCDTLPFYSVEIAPYEYDPDRHGLATGGAMLREAQQRAVAQMTGAYIVSTNDLAYPYERPQIHPCQKRQVGQRLAYATLQHTYAIAGIEGDCPTYKSHEVRGDTVEVAFNHVENGLSPWHDITGFELAGPDGVYHKANAWLYNAHRTILLTAPEVKQPKNIRYCFHDFMPGNLKNTRGLPLTPFRTDNYER